MKIRNATPRDFTQILELNEESVQFLSALSLERLAVLHGQSAYHRVAESSGRIVAFLIAFREGLAYDSPNYRWFASRFERFLYIDRIVVRITHQGLGIGKHFYVDLLAFAHTTHSKLVTCEFDILPPNMQSRRFHEAFGFKEVGTQVYGPSRKEVSLQALIVEARNQA